MSTDPSTFRLTAPSPRFVPTQPVADLILDLDVLNIVTRAHNQRPKKSIASSTHSPNRSMAHSKAMAIFRGDHKNNIDMAMKYGDVMISHPMRRIYTALRDFLREAMPNAPSAPSNKGRPAGRGTTLKTGGASPQNSIGGFSPALTSSRSQLPNPRQSPNRRLLRRAQTSSRSQLPNLRLLRLARTSSRSRLPNLRLLLNH